MDREAIAKLLRDTAYSKNGWLNFYEMADAILAGLAEERDEMPAQWIREREEGRAVRRELEALRAFFHAYTNTPGCEDEVACEVDRVALEVGLTRETPHGSTPTGLAKPPEAGA